MIAVYEWYTGGIRINTVTVSNEYGDGIRMVYRWYNGDGIRVVYRWYNGDGIRVVYRWYNGDGIRIIRKRYILRCLKEGS